MDFNYRVEDHLYPKKDQIYVQCWHGTPLKKLGYDLKGTNNAMNSEEEIHNKYKIDAKNSNICYHHLNLQLKNLQQLGI